MSCSFISLQKFLESSSKEDLCTHARARACTHTHTHTHTHRSQSKAVVPQQQFDLAVCTSEELKREVDECRRQMDSMLREREHLLGTVQELTAALAQASECCADDGQASVQQTHQTHLLELELAIQQGEVFKSRLEQQETEIEELQEKLRQASQQQSPASDLSKDPIDVGSSGLPRPPGGELVGVGLAMLQVQKLMMID